MFFWLNKILQGLKTVNNIEMRNHFNSMIKQLNEITAFVNQKYGYRIIEETAEFGTTPPPIPHVTRNITSGLT